jgi:hypothetical protein
MKLYGLIDESQVLSAVNRNNFRRFLGEQTEAVLVSVATYGASKALNIVSTVSVPVKTFLKLIKIFTHPQTQKNSICISY